MDSFIEVNRISRTNQLVCPTNILKNLSVVGGSEECCQVGVDDLGNGIRNVLRMIDSYSLTSIVPGFMVSPSCMTVSLI